MSQFRIPVVKNVKRGCGHLKPGGFYASGGAFSSTGRLAAWSWVLGDGLIGGHNPLISVPPRLMTIAPLRETLYHGRLSTDFDLSGFTFPYPLQRLPKVALVDHVGRNHYTPWQFAEETIRLGANRRIPAQIAAQIAHFTPIPILFTHQDMPLVDPDSFADLYNMLSFEGATTDTGQTYLNDHWGIYAGDDHGDNHWLVSLLKTLHEGQGKHLTEVVPPQVAENLLFTEGAFGISWILRVNYVVTEQESKEELAALIQRGIQPVQADKETD